MLAARAVSRRYGSRTALEPTDLDVDAGELVIVVGPNGAGKSTLLAILAGALPPSAGAVETALAPTAVGWAPQRPAQYAHLSARENLVLFARLQRLPDALDAAERQLRAFGLPDDDRRSAELSVGNQQRLNLALGFLGEPRLLLLDEPTASLDPEQAAALWERIAEARARAAAAVVATHVVGETLHADRVVVLQEGRVVFAGTQHEYARAERPA